MHQADRDPSEHRLALFLSHIFLQLYEPVGHVVEGETKLPDFVRRIHANSFSKVALGQGFRSARQREDGFNEPVASEISETEHDHERDKNRNPQLPLQSNRNFKRLALRLFDNDRPPQGFEVGRHAQHRPALVVVLF